jgi:hypothetical protein
MVSPDDRLEVEATFVEQIANAFILKGSIRCAGKVALRLEFTCALLPAEGRVET